MLSSNYLRKGFWGSMALTHTPALVSAWKVFLSGGITVDVACSWFLLALSMIFFGMKVWGVRWLQFRADRRSYLAFILMVGLVHLDCIGPGLEQKFPLNTTTIVTTTILAFGSLRAKRALSDVFKRNRSHTTVQSLLPASNNTVWYDVFRPHCWILAFQKIAPRAPPA